MSAWTIGSATAARTTGGAETREIPAERVEGQVGQPTQPSPTVDTIVAWIPGDVIAAYAALMLALQPEPASNGDTTLEVTSSWWLIGATGFAVVLTLLGAWSRTRDLTRAQTIEVAVRAGLAGIAFLIWSLVIPGSWWYSIESFAENSDVVPIVAGLVGVVFGLLAEGIVQRLRQ